MKTSELTGAALDWAVAKCLPIPKDALGLLDLDVYNGFNPSTNWAQGGPIIEREKLCVGHKHQADPEYCPINDPATTCWARTTAGGYLSHGPTPLIAAMRCFVASKLGDDIELPEGLK